MSSPSTRTRRAPPSPETIAQARALMEGTALSQEAIRRVTGMDPRRLRRLMAEGGWRRPPEAPCGRRGQAPALLARMRALVEGTAMTQRAIARELRVSPGHVCRTVRRHGWTRPLLAPTDGATVAVRWTKRSGRPFRIDVIAAVRDLYTGTILSLGAIGARTGVSLAHVSALGRRHGWTRPEGAPRSCRDLRPGRASLGPRLRDGRRRVRALAESWATAWAAEPGGAAAAARARGLAARAAAGAP